MALSECLVDMFDDVYMIDISVLGSNTVEDENPENFRTILAINLISYMTTSQVNLQSTLL